MSDFRYFAGFWSENWWKVETKLFNKMLDLMILALNVEWRPLSKQIGWSWATLRLILISFNPFVVLYSGIQYTSAISVYCPNVIIWLILENLIRHYFLYSLKLEMDCSKKPLSLILIGCSEDPIITGGGGWEKGRLKVNLPISKWFPFPMPYKIIHGFFKGVSFLFPSSPEGHESHAARNHRLGIGIPKEGRRSDGVPTLREGKVLQ